MVHTELVDGPLPPIESNDDRDGDGAELIFHGRVRANENGEVISGLRYEYYPQMAESELKKAAERIVQDCGVTELRCWHRVGDVGAGEASLRVSIWSPHRAEALQAMAQFIHTLKRDVPIWKWVVREDGTAYPCGECSGCAHPA